MAKGLEPLFSELDGFIQGGEYEDASATCDKILKLDPNDLEAFQCKVVCLVHLSQFDEAVSLIDRNGKHGPQMGFERAYCFYRLKKYNDALKALQTITDSKSVRVVQLEAQVRYGLEEYERSAGLYQELLKTHKITTSELKTNLCAALALANSPATCLEFVDANSETLGKSFELAYNAASAAIASHDYARAQSLLDQAEKVCRETLADELEEDEIEDELAVVHVQQAYVWQRLNQPEKALAILQPLLKRKPSNEAAWAVGANNMAALQGEHGLFESEKLLKRAANEKALDKLISAQRRTISSNQAIVLINMHKPDLVREELEKLRKAYPNWAQTVLIQAALLYKTKKFSQCEDMLKEEMDKSKTDSLDVPLSLAQIYLNKGETARAVEVLGSLLQKAPRAGIVAGLVQLATSGGVQSSASGAAQIHHLRDPKPVLRIFDAIENGPMSKDPKNVPVLKAIAQFKQQHQRHKDAAALYRRLFDLDKRDLESHCRLVIALAQSDAIEAEKAAARLPALKDAPKLDGEALEKSATIPARRAQQQAEREEKEKEKEKEKVGANAAAPAAATATPGDSAKGKIAKRKKAGGEKDGAAVVEKKKKKKKKKRLPKNYDPLVAPDPERWLPKVERSNFKRQRGKKRDINLRGAQGSASAQLSDVESTPAPAKVAAAATSANQGKQSAAVVAAQNAQKAASGASTPPQIKKAGGARRKGRR